MKRTSMALMVSLLVIMSGCRTKERIVEVEREVVKTEYKTKLERDSVYLRDSVYVIQRGDTVWVNKYKYLYKDKLRVDTLMCTDTVRQERTKIVEVNRLTKSQEFRNGSWWKLVGILILLLMWTFRKFIGRLIGIR